MNALNTWFRVSSCICLLGWVLLIGFPRWEHTDTVIIFVVVALLCAIYAYVLFVHKNVAGETYPRGNFFSLNGVANLFKNPRAVLAGWVHYMAFDLMVGLYIKNDALAHDINFWLMVPVLLLTLMFGPAGLLVYLVLKLVWAM